MHAAAVLARSASASASARARSPPGGPLPWMTPEGVEIQFLELGGLVGVVKKKFLGVYTGPSTLLTPFSPRPPLFRLTGDYCCSTARNPLPRCMRRRRLRLSHAQLRRQPFRIYPLISTTFEQQQHCFQTKNSLIPSPCVLFPLSEPLEWPSSSEMVLMSPQLTMLPAQLLLQHSDSELLLLKDV